MVINSILIVVVFCVSVQVDADDVLTKEEQLSVLFNARRICELAMKSKQKIGKL